MAAQSDIPPTVEEDDFIRVASSENGDFMEFPKEEDNTVIFSSIKAQFPSAVGLKHRGTSGAWRAVRDVEGNLVAPKEGWGNQVYVISIPEVAAEEKKDTRKRKGDNTAKEGKPTKRSKEDEKLLKDLPVTKLHFNCTNKELREYFEKNYGAVEFCTIKKDPETKKSRGFGFIRFKELETAREAVNSNHTIHNRPFYVKVKMESPLKLFVGMLPKDIKKQEIQEYFGQFGDINDIYLPKPFRNFGFVTYAQKHDALKVIKKEHKIKGRKLNVEEASPGPGEQGGQGGYNMPPAGQQGVGGGGYQGGYGNYPTQYPTQYPSMSPYGANAGGSYGGGPKSGGAYGAGPKSGGPYGGGPKSAGSYGGRSSAAGRYGDSAVEDSLKSLLYNYLGGGGGF